MAGIRLQRARPATRRRAAWALAGSAAALLVGGPSVSATERDAVVAQLHGLASSTAVGLRTWANDGRETTLRVGDPLEYHFESERDGYLTAVHVDPHGVVTVLYPSRLPGGNRVEPGARLTFPGPEAGFALNVEPPVGREDLFAVVTREPIDPDDLRLSFAAGPLAIVEAREAEALVARLARALRNEAPGGAAFAHLEQRTIGRSAEAEYLSGDVVAYFTTRARAIRRPRLDVHVRFSVDSAELDASTRRSLDAVGEAFQDTDLAGLTFVVGGHTDDVGTDAYNIDLSRRRAESVQRYLMTEHGIEAGRLVIRAYGEAQPIEADTSPDARASNRRVEFELER